MRFTISWITDDMSGVCFFALTTSHAGTSFQATLLAVLGLTEISPVVEVNTAGLSAACPKILNDVGAVLTSSTSNSTYALVIMAFLGIFTLLNLMPTSCTV